MTHSAALPFTLRRGHDIVGVSEITLTTETVPTRTGSQIRTMETLDLYPIIVTDELKACRDFYTRWFAFEVVSRRAGGPS